MRNYDWKSDFCLILCCIKLALTVVRLTLNMHPKDMSPNILVLKFWEHPGNYFFQKHGRNYYFNKFLGEKRMS